MEYTYLGRSGIQVSKFGMGTRAFGERAAAAAALMERAAELGVNFFETAPTYHDGRSEEIIGRWLEKRREQFILATCAGVPDERPDDSARDAVLASVDGSLKRLRTDWLDLLYLEHFDHTARMAYVLDAVTELVHSGKVLYVGVRGFSAWQTMKVIAMARENGYAPIVATQPRYSLVRRLAEVEIFPMAQAEKIAVTPCNVLAGGLLAGSRTGEKPGPPTVDEPRREIAQRLARYATAHDRSPAALAAAWAATHPAVAAPFIGAGNLAQLNDTMQCLDYPMNAEERAALTAISVEPPLATDR